MSNTFSSEAIDSSPSVKFSERYATEKRTNVYYVPGTNKFGQSTFFYAIVSAALHDKFMAGLQLGVIPDFAVVVEAGIGEPSTEVKEKIKSYYGFDHDFHANNDNFVPLDSAEAS